MEFSLDFRLGIPIYVQIMEQIKHQIAVGVLQPGDQLPTVRQMAADLRVNFNTIARAYRLLDDAGIISTQHGRGTYILAETTKEESALLRRLALDELTQHYLEGAAHMDFSPQEVVDIFEAYLKKWKAQRSSQDDEV